MVKIKSKTIYFLSLLSLIFLIPSISFAVDTGLESAKGNLLSGTLPSIIAQIINGLLSILGTLFIVLIIYGGFKWMTSQGNEDKVKKARELMINATIGVIIVLLAYLIVKTVIDIIVTGNVEGMSEDVVVGP